MPLSSRGMILTLALNSTNYFERTWFFTSSWPEIDLHSSIYRICRILALGVSGYRYKQPPCNFPQDGTIVILTFSHIGTYRGTNEMDSSFLLLWKHVGFRCIWINEHKITTKLLLKEKDLWWFRIKQLLYETSLLPFKNERLHFDIVLKLYRPQVSSSYLVSFHLFFLRRKDP